MEMEQGMESRTAITAALDGNLTFQREISQLKLLTPLPLSSNERRANLALADEQEAEATQLLWRAHDLRKAAIQKKASYAAIRLLPPEILGNIFVLAIPEYPHPFRFEGSRLPSFSVLEVNRWWRSIAINTPALWAEIIIYYNAIYSKRSITNLAIWLERAKHSKLEVHMYNWNADGYIQQTMWNMICSHLNHCTRLMHVSASPITAGHMAMFCNCSGIYKDMTSIELEMSPDDGSHHRTRPLISPLLPRLCSLSLVGSIAGWDITFNAPCLEKLRLGKVTIDSGTLCAVLNRYSTTLRLELSDVSIVNIDDESVHPCHLYLEELTLAYFTSTKQFWMCLTPCLLTLNTLIIRESYYTVYDSMPVLPSVRHLSFQMQGAERLYHRHQYRDFLNRAPNITELSLDARYSEWPESINVRYPDPIIKELFVNEQDMSSVVCPDIRHVGIYLARTSQKRILRLSRTRAAFLLGVDPGGLKLLPPFTVTTWGCVALCDMNLLALPELEVACKQFPQQKLQRHNREDLLHMNECVENCDCKCEDQYCDCCNHYDTPSDSDDDP